MKPNPYRNGDELYADEIIALVDIDFRDSMCALPLFYRPTAVRVFPLSLAYSKGERPPSEV